MGKLEFITSSKEVFPPIIWLQELAKYLDIEFTDNLERIRNSNKSCLIWNPLSYILSKHKKWKIDLWKYRKDCNKPVYAVERGYLPDCLYIDHNGGLAESESYYEKYWNYPLTKTQSSKISEYINNFMKDITTLEIQNSLRLSKKQFYKKLKLNIKEHKKIIFIPFQKANDTTILLWADWIKTMNSFRDFILKLAKKYPDIIFLVKAHPRRPNFNVLSHNNIKNVDNLHYKDCIEYSNIILTINSGVGLQAMMWKKPVITIGKAFYQFPNINYKAKNEKEVEELLFKAKSPDYTKVKRFIYYLKYNFYTDCEMKNLRPVKTTRIVFTHPLENRKVIIEP